ncbi:toll/interleukin-1 receptor domain-containing protein [Clostridium sp.]
MPKVLQHNIDYTKFALYANISSKKAEILFRELYNSGFFKLNLITPCPNCKCQCTIDTETNPKEFNCPICNCCFEWSKEINKSNFTYKLNSEKENKVIKQRTGSPLDTLLSQKNSGEGKVIKLPYPLKNKDDISVFLSYCHKDEEYKNKLESHFVMLKRNGIITTWDDRKIIPGQNLNEEINKNLLSADIIILIISVDFLNSTYCFDKEMTKALEMNTLNQARVIPVIVRPCDWLDSPFKDLEALPSDGISISKSADKDEAFLEVVTGIKEVIKDIKSKKI